jgi:hypothetical protein
VWRWQERFIRAAVAGLLRDRSKLTAAASPLIAGSVIEIALAIG